MAKGLRLAEHVFLMIISGFAVWMGSDLAALGRTTGRQVSQVPIIVNGKIPQPPDKKQRTFLFKEDLTIGIREGDENYMFGERVYFNVDDDGNIYVTDWDRKRIQKYGPDGKYLLTIGREGQGPGEFQNIWEPEFDKEGNLYAVDIAQKRISFFSREGQFVRQIGFPNVSPSSSIFVTSQGRYLMATSEIKKEDEAGVQWDTVIGLYDDKFGPLAVFHRENRESKSPKSREQDDIAQFWADLMSDTAFKPSAHYALAPNEEIFLGFSNTYEIKVYSAEGQPARTIRKVYDATPVTGQDKVQYEEFQKTEFLRFLPAQFETAKKKALQLIRYPKFKPAYQGFSLADNGWLYMIVERRGSGATVLDVFDAEGHYLVRTEAPIPAEMLRFKKGRAYAIATEDGYKSVKRFSYTVREN